MDYEEKKRRQLIRVVIAEIGMAISVVAIVVVATLVAMGFFIDTNGQIEQSGLVQVRSVPTGATVELDGATLFARTNLQRSLTPGEHYIKLTRSGYDTWEKVFTMYPGVLMRMYYPRLFLLDRVITPVLKLGESGAGTQTEVADALEFYLRSPDHNYLLYAMDNAAEWRLLELKGDDIKETILDLSGILPGMVAEEQTGEQRTGAERTSTTPNYRFEGEILQLNWSENNEKVLLDIKYNDQQNWVLVNLKDVTKSINLTETFGLEFEQIEMIDTAANQLYGLENGHLRKINTADGSVSKILLDKIISFDSFETNVAYVTKTSTGKAVGVYRDGEAGGTLVQSVEGDQAVRVALSKYLGEDYFAYIVDDILNVIFGSLPSYREEGASLDELKELIGSKKLAATPDSFTVSPDGEYLVARHGTDFMVADLEMGDVYEYDAGTTHLHWLSDGMMYAVRDGQIIVWDYDHQNERNLAKSAQTETKQSVEVLDFAVTLTENGRWLYYVARDDQGKLTLWREQVRD